MMSDPATAYPWLTRRAAAKVAGSDWVLQKLVGLGLVKRQKKHPTGRWYYDPEEIRRALEPAKEGAK